MSDKKEDIHIVQAESMRRFCIAACRTLELSQEHAELIADVLLQADLRGVDSHGIARFPMYVKGYKSGITNPHPSIKVMEESGATAVVDGDNGLGSVVSNVAMNLAIDKAAKYGIGTVTVRKSGHYGMAAYWSMTALKHDMIGYTTTNAPPSLAPWGGITTICGNNPISYAIPANNELPLVLDMAMSVVSMGKIRLAALNNQPIPQGWALDKNGEPTTDAQEAAEEGLFVPIGDHKGYGMALVNDILCGVLSGGSFGTDISKPQPGCDVTNVCHFFMALDISHFMPITEFKERVDRFVSMTKGSRLAKGRQKVYLPGEKEFETQHQRTRQGIPYSKEVISQLQKVALDLDIILDI